MRKLPWALQIVNATKKIKPSLCSEDMNVNTDNPMESMKQNS